MVVGRSFGGEERKGKSGLASLLLFRERSGKVIHQLHVYIYVNPNR